MNSFLIKKTGVTTVLPNNDGGRGGVQFLGNVPTGAQIKLTANFLHILYNIYKVPF